MDQTKSAAQSWSIVAADKFIRATRDSGYKSTASAISELVDNSIQAAATRVQVNIDQTPEKRIEITVEDNGSGMDLFTLRQALRFGGSSRFDDRSGLGRFGMGLPNSSLSQARRVIVTSWQNVSKGAVKKNVLASGLLLQSYLDLDEIASGRLVEVPKPKAVANFPSAKRTASGTIVKWESCDRLDYKRAPTIARHVIRELSQRFRHFLEAGTKIYVNRHRLRPIDPMFLLGRPANQRSKLYGRELSYQISANPEEPSSATGIVRIRFVELPIQLATLSNAEKREQGIVNSAGISIIRARREVDYGWFFFGAKRKENYDDWWRCEVSFDPVLDEAFGLTHTKQQIRPQQYLLDILTPDMESIARTLNARARNAHSKLKESDDRKQSEKVADIRSKFLNPVGHQTRRDRRSEILAYRIEEAPLSSNSFYTFRIERGTFVLTIDPDHAFYREIYAPLHSGGADIAQVRTLIELLLIAAARSEASASHTDAKSIESFRVNWSRTAETLIGG